MRSALPYLFIVAASATIMLISGGCANIIPPTGGPRDSLPPVLVSAVPGDSAKNIKPARITLTFNEYVDQLQNVTENVIISPTLSTVPQIDSKLKTVTVRIKDTLEPNTTYTINFGNAIKDVNEGNVLKNFTYTFSTGATIDENTLSGRVILAESGKTDSSLIAVLHRDLSDSSIIRQRPRYYARLDGKGNFTFNNLPEGRFNVFVIQNSFMKQYTDTTSLFAFMDAPVVISDSTPDVLLYAYRQGKPKPNVTTSATGNNTGGRSQDKRLRYTNNEGTIKDVLSPLQLEFMRKLKTFDSTAFILTDTNYVPLSNYSVHLDSNRTKVSVSYPWQLETKYKLIIQKAAVADKDDITLIKNDTLSFTTKREQDYGSVKIRFNDVDISKKPLLQIVLNDVVIESAALTGKEYRKNIFRPGEYELRILYDANNNGVWDAGNYTLKKQPEIAISITKKLTVKANWDNEVEIVLGSGGNK